MSSATPNKKGRAPGLETGDAGSAKPSAPSTLWLVWLVPLVAGWLFILKISNWHLVPPALLLATGWLAVLATGVFLLQAGMAAVSGAGEEDFWRPEGRRDELLAEKKSLLKAIKEIEFDHQLGKMSDEDAARLSRFYRTRAIEIIKGLDGVEATVGARPRVEGDLLAATQRIERDVAARLEPSEAAGEDSGDDASAGEGERGQGE